MTEFETYGWTTSTLNPDDYEVEKAKEVTEETKEETVKKSDIVDHPFYYNRENAIECIEEMELIYGPEAVMWFCLLNAHKYRYRAGLKNNGYEDLEKSDWYMKKYKELKEKIQPTQSILGGTITAPYTPTTPIVPWQPWQINPVTWTCTTTGRGTLANE